MGLSNALRLVSLDKEFVQWWTYRPLESFLGLIKGSWKKEILFPLKLLINTVLELTVVTPLLHRGSIFITGENTAFVKRRSEVRDRREMCPNNIV